MSDVKVVPVEWLERVRSAATTLSGERHPMTDGQRGTLSEIAATAVLLVADPQPDTENSAGQGEATDGSQWIAAGKRDVTRGDLWLAIDANGKLYPGVFVNHRIPADATLVQRIVLPLPAAPEAGS